MFFDIVNMKTIKLRTRFDHLPRKKHAFFSTTLFQDVMKQRRKFQKYSLPLEVERKKGQVTFNILNSEYDNDLKMTEVNHTKVKWRPVSVSGDPI